MTTKRKIEIYGMMLDSSYLLWFNSLQTCFGMCRLLNLLYANVKIDRPESFLTYANYPELYRFKPPNKKYNDYWCELTEEGLNKREQWLQCAILECLGK